MFFFSSKIKKMLNATKTIMSRTANFYYAHPKQHFSVMELISTKCQQNKKIENCRKND